MDVKMFDIIFVEIEKAYGSEQAGIHPYVVIQNNIGNKYSTTVLGMSLTSKIKKTNMPTHCVVHKTVDNGLDKNSMVLAETLTQISKDRIIRKVGSITDEKTKNDVINAYLANITGKNSKASTWSIFFNTFCKKVKELNYVVATE